MPIGMRGKNHSEYSKLLISMVLKGRKRNKETIKRISESKIGDKNPMWRGDKVKMKPLHGWVRTRLPRPEFCMDCKNAPPRDLANKGIYNRELINWEWLCRRCHMLKDGRMNNLKQYANSKL